MQRKRRLGIVLLAALAFVVAPVFSRAAFAERVKFALPSRSMGYLPLFGDAIEFPSNGYSTTEHKLAENKDQVKRVRRALYRGLMFARERPAETMAIIEREWKLDPIVAKESYTALSKSFSKDGTSSDAGLRVHTQLFQKMEKGIGEIPMGKIVDFRLLDEIRREENR